MENLKLTRIDFRLIHGQVMARWVKQFDIDHIIVIDDKTAKSPILKKIILNAAPKSIKTEVLTVQQAATRWNDNTLSDKKLLILFKDINGALSAYDAGINYDSLQVGGIEGSGDKKNVNKNVVMSKEEMLQLKSLNDKGVDVFIQPIPEDSCLRFPAIENKF